MLFSLDCCAYWVEVPSLGVAAAGCDGAVRSCVCSDEGAE